MLENVDKPYTGDKAALEAQLKSDFCENINNDSSLSYNWSATSQTDISFTFSTTSIDQVFPLQAHTINNGIWFCNDPDVTMSSSAYTLVLSSPSAEVVTNDLSSAFSFDAEKLELTVSGSIEYLAPTAYSGTVIF